MVKRESGRKGSFWTGSGSSNGTSALPCLELLESRRLFNIAPQADTLPTVQLRITTSTAAESGTPARSVGKCTISRTGLTSAPLEVSVAVSGTAAASDYILAVAGAPVTNTVTIPAGKRSVTLTLSPIDDAIAEPSETVQIALQASPAYQLSANAAASSGTITIRDNEPVVSIVAVRNATESADQHKGNGSFCISRTGDLSQPLEIHYSLAGTASAGSDYVGLTSVATIPAHARSVALPVWAPLDTNADDGQTIQVILADQEDYHISPTKIAAQVTIRNTPAIDTAAWFGNTLHTYHMTSTSACLGQRDPADAGTLQALFPANLRDYAGYDYAGGYLDMGGTWSTDGLHVDGLLFKTSSGASRRYADAQGVLLIPSVLSGSVTNSITGSVNIFGSQDTIPATTRATATLAGSASVTVPAGTFSTTVLKVSCLTSGRGTVSVPVYDSHGSIVYRRITASVSERFTWTYYLAPGVGIVKAQVSASFAESTRFPVSASAVYEMTAA